MSTYFPSCSSTQPLMAACVLAGVFFSDFGCCRFSCAKAAECAVRIVPVQTIQIAIHRGRLICGLVLTGLALGVPNITTAGIGRFFAPDSHHAIRRVTTGVRGYRVLYGAGSGILYLRRKDYSTGAVSPRGSKGPSQHSREAVFGATSHSS